MLKLLFSPFQNRLKWGKLSFKYYSSKSTKNKRYNHKKESALVKWDTLL